MVNRRTLTVTAIVVLAVVGAAAAALALTRGSGDAAEGVHNQGDPAKVADYWTDERMRDAVGD
ncbi:hypothetical protein DP939_31265 [Spongiactinospora rosea]|uniref:Uncharacterized protein n=1 Tax=Spongiactinospora rosea TaxID=2248750 RepID=A0A366LQD6_9ACTN|nr:hypothetical protein DP939_31265 [Spongiactinospora rosea]